MENTDFQESQNVENVEDTCEATGETTGETTHNTSNPGQAFMDYMSEYEEMGKKLQDSLKNFTLNEKLDNFSKKVNCSFTNDKKPGNIFSPFEDIFSSIVQDSQNINQDSINYDQMITDITRKWEKHIVESGEWQTLMEESPNKKLSDLIFKRAEEYGKEELAELKELKIEQAKEKSAKLFGSIFGALGSFGKESNSSSVKVEEVVEVDIENDGQEVEQVEDLEVNVDETV